MSSLEGTIPVPGGNVWFKRVGGGPGLPLLAVHGGPGLPHNYMSSLERLADEREVIFWDQLGCGNSERPSNLDLWTMERSVAEMDAVIQALGLNRFHIFGNSWGGMLAQQYVLDVTSSAVSLTISNSIASIPQFAEMVARLKTELGPATQSAIDRHEAAGTTHSAEYQAAIRTWNETYLCRQLPWPKELQEAYKGMGAEIFETMFGPSDFRIVLAGRFDECAPEHMWEMHQRIDGSRFELFESSAHMPFIEEPHRFDQVMRDFLQLHD
jgi:proline iminopeptidase